MLCQKFAVQQNNEHILNTPFEELWTKKKTIMNSGDYVKIYFFVMQTL